MNTAKRQCKFLLSNNPTNVNRIINVFEVLEQQMDYNNNNKYCVCCCRLI